MMVKTEVSMSDLTFSHNRAYLDGSDADAMVGVL